MSGAEWGGYQAEYNTEPSQSIGRSTRCPKTGGIEDSITEYDKIYENEDLEALR